MSQYKKIREDVQEQIKEDRRLHKENPFACPDSAAIRRNMDRDKANLWRPAFVRDTEKIMHLPVFNRYADKTQVFSFYKNDDITRRMLHVQLVSRIARSIGAVLGLNLDLIEAVALGHDIGHTPFGHVGERYLSTLLEKEAGIFFNHNVHSVRVIDTLYKRNVTLQTLDGIVCHNGEFELQEYRPKAITVSGPEAFALFDATIADCDARGNKAIKSLIPATLESCLVRICDMIAYLGKDRQDAITAKIISPDEPFTSQEIGSFNATIINNLSVDIINNSYGKDYLLLSPEYFADLKTAKRENYEKIYLNPKLSEVYDQTIWPMFEMIYYKLLDDLTKEDKNSVIYRHHLDYLAAQTSWYTEENPSETDPHRIVADFIASMTDDYFIDLFAHMFPDSPLHVDYKSYFQLTE
ncbi:MAG: HD domain-containing protein [Treponemataceae bacterium]|nr:HD domain-containing protein [Treponemataceae bacterium]